MRHTRVNFDFLLLVNVTWGTKGLSYGLGASDPEGLEPKYHSMSVTPALKV